VKNGNGLEFDNSGALQVKNGAVEKNDKGFVSGSTVYTEVRMETDGEYVKRDTTTAANLANLDKHVAENAEKIVTAQETADAAMGGVAMLLAGTGIEVAAIIATDTKVNELAAQNGEVTDTGKHADEFIKGSTVHEYLNGSNLKIGTGSTTIALGKDSAAGISSVAIGEGSQTTGAEQSTALGYKNIVTGNQSVALGDSNNVSGLQSIAIGHNNTVTGDHSGAIGDPSVINGSNSYSVGNNNKVDAGSSNVFVLGNNVHVTGSNTVVLGGSSDGTKMKVKGSNSVVLGADSDGSQDNVVSVGSSGNERRITHVKDGEDLTDAATVKQLQEVSQGAYNNAIYLNDSINRLDSKVNKVGAGAAALAALHPVEMDNKFGMGLGYGNYRDAHSMSLGLFYRPMDNLMFSIGGSMGNGENMINAGISIALDRGFTSSKAVMARTIKVQGEVLEEQRKANAAQEARIKTLEAENAAIKEQNARLEARLAAIEAKVGK
jgi:hypothetical protein